MVMSMDFGQKVRFGKERTVPARCENGSLMLKNQLSLSRIPVMNSLNVLFRAVPFLPTH